MNGPVQDVLRAVLQDVAAQPERLTAILDERSDPFVAFDGGRLIVTANRAGELFFGYARHELDGRPVEQLVPERLRQPDAPAPLVTEDLTTVELPGLVKDGTEIPTIWIFGSAPSPNGPLFVMLLLERDALAIQVDGFRKSDARYRSLLLASTSIVWITNAEGEFVERQPAWEAYTGQSFEEYRGSKWTSAIHPDDRARVLDNWTTSVQSTTDLYRTHGRVWSVEHNEWRAFQTRGVPVRDAAGAIVEWVCSLTDVQDTLEAQQSAREAERRRFFSILGRMPAIINFFRGPNFVFEFAHPKIVEMSGGRSLVGKPAFEAFPEYHGQEPFARLQRVYSTGEADQLHEVPVHLDVDGRTLTNYWNSVYLPVRDEAGVVEGVMTFDIDVTNGVETRRALELAREDAERTRATLATVQEAAKIGVFQWDIRTSRVLWSPELYQLLGRRPGEVEPSIENWLSQMEPEESALGMQAFRDASANRTPVFEVEQRLVQPDGQVRWVRTTNHLTYDDAGEVVSCVGAAVDITELKQLAERERAARLAAEAASRSKDEFLATMSHELRTPLNAMLGWATMLKKALPNTDKLERGLNVIERNARAQERIISDLLDVSRIISGKLLIRPRRVELASVIHAAADVVRPAAETKGVRLVIDLDPALGDMIIDPDRVQQVVWNLLVNAVRFTPPGGRISLVAERSSSGARITVIDDGSGIAPENLPYVFERFRQIDSSTTRAHGGLGLGLSIVRHLVEAHGGHVEAHSDGLGRGCKFTVVLPIRAVDTTKPSPELETDVASDSVKRLQSSWARAVLRNVRALVVEDDRDSLELITVVLESAGAKVIGFSSAGEALAAPGPFDVIVSEIGMPDMDGYTFMRRIRARGVNGNIPALALTALARSEDAALAVRAGYQEHLPKPIDAAGLVEAVARWARAKLELNEGPRHVF